MLSIVVTISPIASSQNALTRLRTPFAIGLPRLASIPV
jgi:hypothetical protein